MAHMQATGIASEPPSPPVEVQQEPIVEISATLLRAQAFLSGCGIALMVREGEWLVCRASNGAAAPDIGARIPVEQSFLGLCISLKKPQTCEDADTDMRVENATYGRLKPKSILAVPVRAGQDVVAVLGSFSSAPNAFTNTQIAILRTVADSLSRPVQQLPASAPVVETPAPPAEPWATAAQERSIKLEPQKAAEPEPERAAAPQPAVVTPMAPPPPIPIAKPKEVALKVVEPPPPPKPASAEPQHELLTLADEPTLPRRAPEPRITLQPARPATIPVPRSLEFSLPASRPSRFRPALLRIGVITVGCLLSALATAGWYSTHVPAAPRLSVALPETAVVASPAKAETPAAPLVESPVTAVSVRPAKEEAKPSAAIPLHTEAQTAKTAPVPPAAPEPAPLLLTRVAPAPVPTPAAAPITAPVLALAAPAPLPALVAPRVEAPKLHQAVATPARLERRVAPQYPMAALKRRIAGEVTLSLVVRPDGSVAEVKQVSGNPLFRESAMDAVKHWHYSPALLDGKPVQATAQVVLKFELPPEAH